MKRQQITTVSYVRIGDRQVCFSELGDSQRRETATWLKVTYLNHMFQGVAVFQTKGEFSGGHHGGWKSLPDK